jgi:monoamine oxidase
MSAVDFDVIVVGGGFAGCVAARDLAHGGRNVLVLEARDRLGGRAWTRNFADRDIEVEIGGAWVAPTIQPQIASDMARYGLGFKTDLEPHTMVNLIGGQRVEGLVPVPKDEVLALERAMVWMWKSAERINPDLPLDRQSGLDDLDVSWQDFLAPLDLPAATRDYLYGWQSIFGGRTAEGWSALHYLQWFALMGNSPLALVTSLDTKIADGSRALVDALIEDAGVEVKLSSPVAAVEQDDDRVQVTTAGGDVHTAAAAVIATPANIWPDISFTPAINAGKQAVGAATVGGTAIKIWAEVADAPARFLGIGGAVDGKGVTYLGTDRDTDNGQLVVGFSVYPESFDVSSREHVEQAMQAYMPGCRVLAFDGHDWNADPYSKGTWAAHMPGMLSKHGGDLRKPEGRLAFATSDIAPFYAGWIEGALETGVEAAGRAEAIIASQGAGEVVGRPA